jgi:hypothetical protein
MIVVKPTFVNPNGVQEYDTELISLEWKFVLDTLKDHCKEFKYDQTAGFKIWWWAEDDDENEQEVDRTCLLHINSVEPTEQIKNRFSTVVVSKKMSKDHPKYSPEYHTLHLRFDMVEQVEMVEQIKAK